MALGFTAEAVRLSNATMLVALAVMGNFMGETLSCEAQKLLEFNMFAKHAIVMFMIYFTIVYTSPGPGFVNMEDDSGTAGPTDQAQLRSPLYSLAVTVVVWVVFILVSRAEGKFSFFGLSCIAMTYFMETIKQWLYADGHARLGVGKDTIAVFQTGLLGMAMLSVVIGVMISYKKLPRNYPLLKFMLGSAHCSRLKNNHKHR